MFVEEDQGERWEWEEEWFLKKNFEVAALEGACC
jgi:hypothetical protein